MDLDPERYKEIKFKYFTSLASTKGVNKGDVRGFLGVETWYHERERLRAGEDKYTSHVYALEKALDKLEEVVEKDRFTEEFSEKRKVWEKGCGALPRENGGDTLFDLPIPEMRGWGGDGLNFVSLFSGAFGLDIGFMAAGFDLKVANDINENSRQTAEGNIPDVPFIHGDFTEIDPERILNEAGLDVGEVDVLAGGPPCQPFSTAGKREGLNDPRASPLKSYIKAVKVIRPKAFVMEEVTGLKSARLKHVPISERDRELKPEERKGSAFEVVLDMLKSTGYNITWGTLNAADYGSPQIRNRLIFIGLREGEPTLPAPSYTCTPQVTIDVKDHHPWNTLWDATIDLAGGETEGVGLSENREKYIKKVPPGGYWKHLPSDLVEEAMGGAYNSGGGRMGYFRRLSWDYPSPTVTTSPGQKSTMLGHPEEPRPLSIEEYKRIQGFPDDWQLGGNIRDKYRLVGDAVPTHLSYAVAKKVRGLILEGDTD